MRRIKELEREVEELKQQLLLEKGERKKESTWFQNIIDSIPNPLFIKDSNYCFTLVNSSFESFVNIKKEGLLGKSDADFFTAEEAEVFLNIDEEILANGGINWNDEKLTIQGETYNLITSKVRIVDGEENRFLVGLITDVTDKENEHIQLKQKKDELEKEKNNNRILLKETHHRVKNYLQVVSNILSLQMMRFEDKEIHKAFNNCKYRIAAIANVHAILYKTSNFSNINFSTYIQTLTSNLKDSHQLKNYVKFKLDLINIFLNVDICIPMGLAINEIFINSIKHGKVEGESLEIYVKLFVEKGSCVLRIGDDGKGQPEFKGSQQTLGAELLQLFCNQIDADLIHVKLEKGKHYEISFDKNGS